MALKEGPATPPLFEQAAAALRRLGDLPAIGQTAAHLDRAWLSPLVVGLGGDDIASRTELVNFLCGSTVLDPAGRAAGAPVLRVRRAGATRFRARRDDGSIEDHALPAQRRDTAEVAALLARAEAEHAELAERERAHERVDNALPALLRARPSGWRVLLWPIWWLLARLQRHRLADRKWATEAADESRRGVEAAERAIAEADARARIDRTRYFVSLRAVSSGTPSGGVLDVELELANGPLPEGVEVRELGRGSASVDAVVIVKQQSIFAPGELLIGHVEKTVSILPMLLTHTRALRLARVARDAIAASVAELDEQLARAEEELRARVDRLIAMRLADPPAFVQIQIAGLRPSAVASVNAVLEHAAVHLGSELAQLGDSWIGSVAASTTSDELKEAIAQIEQTAAAGAQRIADETRTLVMGGAGGSAHDLYPELVSALIPHGLPEAELRKKRRAPVLPRFEILPSLANTSSAKLSGAAGWLAGLFRSFETRRTDVRETVHARISHIRDVATAELLDAEPQIRAAIEHALDAELHAAIEVQTAALEAAIAAERAAVEAARAQLRPSVAHADRGRRDLAAMTAQIANF